MEKRGRFVLLKIISLLFIFILINAGYLFFAYPQSFDFKSMTGFSVKKVVDDTYSKMTLTQKLIFAFQILLFLIIVLFISSKEIVYRSKKNNITSEDIKKFSKKQGTDLDTLYSILQIKKKLLLSNIAKPFNVNSEIAMEWCKILESNNLAVIEYPALSEPLIKIK